MLETLRGARAALSRCFAPLFALALVMVGSLPAFATGVTLPETGVDVAGHVTATITALGAVLVVIVGGYFAFLLVRKAMRWGARALG